MTKKEEAIEWFTMLKEKFTGTEYGEYLDMAIRSLEAWDAVKADIHGMEFIYDKSPLFNDKRTDAQKASDWWGIERLIILDIINKHLREVENGRYSEF